MAAFPIASNRIVADYTETPQPAIERSPMERGIPKQRRITSDIRVELAVTVAFLSKSEDAAFKSWFYSTINAGESFFDFVQPNTKATVQARIVNGDIGTLMADRSTLDLFRRTFKVEYWQSAW